MDSTRRRLLRTVAAAGVAGSIAGCLDQIQRAQPGTTAEPMETPTETPEPTDTGTETDHTVAVADHDEHGEILVDAEGMVLYLFTEDSRGESACYDSCAENWPPLTVEDDPSAESDLPGTLGTTSRDDGSMQVTYNGWPLYYWVQDEEPGDVTGHGVNDVWFVVPPDREPPAESTTTSNDGTTDGDDGTTSDGDNGGTDGGGNGSGGYGPDYYSSVCKFLLMTIEQWVGWGSNAPEYCGVPCKDLQTLL